MTVSDSQRYTLNSLQLCLIKNELYIYIHVYNLENYLISFVVSLYKSDLRISTAEKHIGIIIIKHYN